MRYRAPDFPIEGVEDAYAYFVLVLGMSEDVFWDADIPFLLAVVDDRNAYEKWSNAVASKMREEARH